MFTKYAEVEVVNTTGADEVVAFLKKLFLRHGCPTTVLSDNGKAFISASVTKLYEEFGIQGKKTTPYNPQGNGVVERLNRSEEHTSELQSLMRISYDVFCLNTKTT